MAELSPLTVPLKLDLDTEEWDKIREQIQDTQRKIEAFKKLCTSDQVRRLLLTLSPMERRRLWQEFKPWDEV